MKSRNNNSITDAAVAAISAVTSFYNISSASSLAAISAAIEIDKQIERNERQSKWNERYIRNSAIPIFKESVWFKVDRYRDEKEFFHFTSLTQISFNELAEVTQLVINKLSVNRDYRPPKNKDIRIISSARDIVAITMKYLTIKSEIKDFYVQFGVIYVSYIMHIELGMNAIANTLFTHK